MYKVVCQVRVRQANGTPELFHNAGGRAMTRAGFEYILDKHVSTAGKEQSSIAKNALRLTCFATMPLPGLCRGDQTEVAQDPQNAGGGGTHSVQDAA